MVGLSPRDVVDTRAPPAPHATRAGAGGVVVASSSARQQAVGRRVVDGSQQRRRRPPVWVVRGRRKLASRGGALVVVGGASVVVVGGWGQRCDARCFEFGVGWWWTVSSASVHERVVGTERRWGGRDGAPSGVAFGAMPPAVCAFAKLSSSRRRAVAGTAGTGPSARRWVCGWVEVGVAESTARGKHWRLENGWSGEWNPRCLSTIFT